MRTLTELFGRSPFGPLGEHAERVHETVQLLRPLFEAFTAGDWEPTREIYERISKLEHKADVIKNELRDHLPKSLFMPVDRGDVLLLLKEQDAVADRAEDLGVILSIRRTVTPAALRDRVIAFVDQIIGVSEAWHDLMSDLPTLLETSFSGPEVENAVERTKRISDLEWEADKTQAAVSKALLEREDELGALNVVFWMHILEVLGDVANHAENSADLLRLMLARR